MSLKNTKRRYGHSDTSIKQLGDKLLIAARRDLPKLVHYGETEESLSLFGMLAQRIPNHK